MEDAIRRPLTAGLVLVFLGFGTAAQEGPIRIVDLADTSAAGTRWRNGVDLAVREINARGGVLGRQVVVTHGEAVADKADLILVRSPTAALAPSQVPVLVGGRAGVSGATQLAGYIADGMKARSVALIWTESAAHRDYRDALVQHLVTRRVAIPTEIATPPQHIDFSAAVLRVREARADALVAVVDEAEAAHLLRERHRQAYDKPVVGPAALVAPKVIEAIGAAANGARAVIGLSPDSPAPSIRAALRSYERAYGAKGDTDTLLGYSAVYVAKAVAERAGRLDADAFARAMKDGQLSATDQPGLLLDVAFDGSGAAERGALAVEIRDGKPVTIDLLPPGR